jgi:mono/diheme cytochrome c family protein
MASLVLFGDLYAKAGNLDQATLWYTLAAVSEGGWAWEGLGADRLANVEARIAAYDDPDPANHPLVIGAFSENCVVCHSRPVE